MAHRALDRGRGGQTLFEFALVTSLTVIMLFGVIEISRMVLVYTTVANAARAGARYAVVHGSNRTGSGVDGPSGPANNPAQVLTVVKNVASAGLVKGSLLAITVTYPGGSNVPGQILSVRVIYPYDPFTAYFPFRINLGSVTQGVILY